MQPPPAPSASAPPSPTLHRHFLNHHYSAITATTTSCSRNTETYLKLLKTNSYQQSSAMSDNVEINSSSAPVLSHNVEDKTDNEVEKFSVSTVSDKKSKEETGKKKKKTKSLKLGSTLQK
ncbi:hypothetical protein WN943_029586 [Citrus x changshan-huyou]